MKLFSQKFEVLTQVGHQPKKMAFKNFKIRLINIFLILMFHCLWILTFSHQ